MKNKRYLQFRDIDNNANAYNDKSFHAAGLVDSESDDIPTPSGKDYAVIFINPFTLSVERQWRNQWEIELFEIEEQEYNEIQQHYLEKTKPGI